MARTLSKATIAAVVLAALTVVPRTSAQQRPASLRDQLVGTWLPVRQYVEQDGKRLEPFGADPKGIVVYDANGRFVLVLQRATLPKFASNNRLTGTPDENRAIVQGSIAYFGTYAVDERSGELHVHYNGSTFPNWDGVDQTRSVTIAGDELTMVSAASAVGGGSVHLVLKRAR